MTAGLTFKLDKNAIALIVDQDKKKGIGTAFVFIQTYWAVTARHVVIQDGVPRRKLELSFLSKSNVPANVLFAHPTLDLAVLEFADGPCDSPLFPSHHQFSGSNGLITVGYAPSKGLVFETNRIDSFTTERRDRVDGSEELIVFDAPFAEGGNSGGPVFGEGAGVVGAVIQDFLVDSNRKSRATSLRPLLRQLQFREG
jgi:S1-C subfamily serine protease